MAGTEASPRGCGEHVEDYEAQMKIALAKQ
jgi:hypothetical protein